MADNISDPRPVPVLATIAGVAGFECRTEQLRDLPCLAYSHQLMFAIDKEIGSSHTQDLVAGSVLEQLVFIRLFHMNKMNSSRSIHD